MRYTIFIHQYNHDSSILHLLHKLAVFCRMSYLRSGGQADVLEIAAVHGECDAP